jgi:membrane associated rhomboid family serine protease
MKFLDRFCHIYNRFGVPNLMFYILGGNVFVFAAVLLTQRWEVAAAFYFHPGLIAQGQVWRLVTFLFVPPIMPTNFLNIVFFGFFVYLYYLMGRTLEDVFGRMKFTIYYFSGAILTALFSWYFGIIADAIYLNLAIFLAFATINPDFTLRLFMIIPVKIKWLAYFNAAYQVYIVIVAPFPHKLLPVVALFNYMFYFWPYFVRITQRSRYRAKTVSFKRTVAKAKKERGYIHKCSICGLTDGDAPGQEFRYCSLCTGYKCYCEKHLFDHEHT